MSKKIFDIIPPHLVRHSTKSSKTKASKKKQKAQFPSVLVFGSVFTLVVVLSFGTYLYFALAKVNVQIWPKTQDVSFSEKIMADISVSVLNLNTKKIPAQIITEEKELWQEYSATGSSSKDGKATGTIRVYNKYTPATPISLKLGTHFLSDTGKSFVSTTKINIPAAKVSGSKITPSYVDISVIAEEGGDSYNIGPSKFSVPKLAGTAYYYTVYADSSVAMKGGFYSDSKIVSTDDIQNAKDDLTKKLLDQTEEALRARITSDEVLVDGAILKEIVEAASLVKAGSEVDKFNYKAKVKITAIIFKKSDLKKFSSDYILTVAGTEKPKTVLEESLNFEYVVNSIDIDNGKMSLNINASSRVYNPIDELALIPLFAGKDTAEINSVIANTLIDQVARTNINMSPFWVKKAPKNQKNIKVELKFD